MRGKEGGLRKARVCCTSGSGRKASKDVSEGQTGDMLGPSLFEQDHMLLIVTVESRLLDASALVRVFCPMQELEVFAYSTSQ